MDAIINSRLASRYAPAVSSAAIGAGLPESSLESLLAAFAAGTIGQGVEGATPQVWEAAVSASRWEYARAYRLGWASIIPFVVIGLVSVSFLRGVKELMTEKVEVSLEYTDHQHDVERSS